jgi:hypothetical protein
MMRKWIWRPVTAGLGVALVAIGVYTIISFLPARENGSDFSQVYVAARVMQDGLNPYEIALDQYATDHNLHFSEIVSQTTNPPVLVWMLQPLGRLEPSKAFALLVAVEFFSLLVVMACAVRLLGRRLSPAGWCLAAGLLCCSMPIFFHFWFSQVQLPLLALVMAGVLALRSRRPWTACMLLTLATALKFYPAPLVALPALMERGQKRWQLAGVTALWLAVWAVVPGWSLWVGFVRHGLPLLMTMGSGWYYNFTVTSTLMDLWRPAAGSEWWPSSVALVISATLVGWAWWTCSHKSMNEDNAVSLLLITSLICSTIAWVHYLIWLFYPLCVLASRRRWLLSVLALICLNAAGSNPLDLTGRVAKFLNASAPLMLMGVLYVYFSVRGEEPAP